MATAEGNWESRARIEWDYAVHSPAPGADSTLVEVYAYLRMDGGTSINGTWPVYWSGAWGSGSASQNLVLGPNQRAVIVGTYGSLMVGISDTPGSASFAVSVSHYWGSTGSTLWVALPKKAYNAPAAPSTPGVTRNSDSSQTITWNRAATTAAPYTSQQVQRRAFSNNAWGPWVSLTTLSASYTNSGGHTYTDTSTLAGGQYQYRIKAANPSGERYSTESVQVHTTPLPLATITPTKLASTSIRIDVALSGNQQNLETTLEYSVGGGPWTSLTTLPAGTTTYTWNSVPPGSSVVFRGRSIVVLPGAVGHGLFSAWLASAAVPLTAPPNSASNLSPNGTTFTADSIQVFSWLYNSADSSAQTAYELRYRELAGAWVSTGKITSATASHSYAANTFTNGQDYEWQVRTWGAHEDPSDYSSLAVFSASAPPTATIASPGSVLAGALLTVAWVYYDSEGSTQSMWEAVLSLEGTPLESLSGSGSASSAGFTTRLNDGVEYQVAVRVRDGASLWSAWDTQTFTTDFPLPVKPELYAMFNEQDGSVGLQISNPSGVTAWQEVAINHAPSLLGPTTPVEVRRNLITTPLISQTTTGWAFASGTTHTPVSGGREFTTPALQQDSAVYRTNTDVPVAPGDVVSVGALVSVALSDTDVPVKISVYWLGSGTHSYGPVVTVSAGSSELLLLQGAVAPAGATHARLTISTWYPTPTQAKFTVADGATLVKAPSLAALFAGGLPSTDPDLTPSWTGTANASESILTGQHLTALNDTNCISILTAAGDEIRLIPKASTNGSFTSFSIPNTAGLRTDNTVMGTLRIPAVLTGTQNSVGRRIDSSNPAGGASVQAPNAAGVYPLRGTRVATALTSGYVVRLIHGGAAGSGDVYWSNIGLFAGDYQGPWFDGDTEGDYFNRYQWSSSPYESSAVWETRGYSDTPLPGTPVTTHNELFRSIDGGVTWVSLGEGATNSLISDRESPLGLPEVLYKAVAWSSLPSFMESLVTAVSTKTLVGQWSAGNGFIYNVQLRINQTTPPKLDLETGLNSKTLHYFAGRTLPVETTGIARKRIGTVEFVVPSFEELQQVRHMAVLAAPHLFRLPDTTMLYASIGEVSETRLAEGWYHISFSVTEVEP